MRLRHLVVGGALATATACGFAGPAFAHDCFNPNKPAGAGVNYTIVGFNPDGSPILAQTGPGQGIGGFAALSPDLTGGQQAPDVHTIGNSQSLDVVGGPGSQTSQHLCDGKGIDYLDACFGAG
jgi:hypothetical protein